KRITTFLSCGNIGDRDRPGLKVHSQYVTLATARRVSAIRGGQAVRIPLVNVISCIVYLLDTHHVLDRTERHANLYTLFVVACATDSYLLREDERLRRVFGFRDPKTGD